jgi:hypothetical protein
MRSLETLRRLPSPELTDPEYVARLVDAYYQHTGCSCRISLLQFTGMSADEYAAWILRGTVPERLMRVEHRRERAGTPMIEQQTESYTPRVGDRVRVARYIRTTAGARSDERVYVGRITEVEGPEAGDWFIDLDTHPDRIYTGYQFLGAGNAANGGPSSLVTEVTPLDDTDGQEAYRVQVTPDLAVTLDGSQCVTLDVTDPQTGVRLHQVTVANVAELKEALDGALAARQVVEAVGNARRMAGPDAARRARGQLTKREAAEWLIDNKGTSRGGALRAVNILREGGDGTVYGMTYADGYWRVPVDE